MNLVFIMVFRAPAAINFARLKTLERTEHLEFTREKPKDEAEANQKLSLDQRFFCFGKKKATWKRNPFFDQMELFR